MPPDTADEASARELGASGPTDQRAIVPELRDEAVAVGVCALADIEWGLKPKT